MIKNLFLKILNNLGLKAFWAFSHLNLYSTISWFKQDKIDGSIWLDPVGKFKLYAIKLESPSNCEHKLSSMEVFNDLKTLKNAVFTIAFVKKEKTGSIYIFSIQKTIIEMFAHNLEIQMLEPPEILSAIYDCYMMQTTQYKDYHYEELYTKDFLGNEVPDQLFLNFPAQIGIAADNLMQNYTPIQSVGFSKNESYSCLSLFNTKWKGVLFYNFDMQTEHVKAHLDKLEMAGKLGDPAYKKGYDEIKDNPSEIETFKSLVNNHFICNACGFIENINILPILQSTLGTLFEVKYWNADKLIRRSPFMSRDASFDLLVKDSFCFNMIRSTLQKDCLKGRKDDGTVHLTPDFFGTDLNGNFVNFMLKGNQSPHCLVFGTTGAGKSVATLKIMSQIIGFDFNTKKANRLSSDRKIRYINVGYTGGAIFESLMKQNTDERTLVNVLSSNLDLLRFGILDLETHKDASGHVILSESELDELCDFINLMLAISSGEINNEYCLTPNEQNALKSEIKAFFNRDWHSSVTLMELADDPAFAEYARKILEEVDENGNKIYQDYTILSDLSDKYSNFRDTRTFAQLVNEVEQSGKDINKTEVERKVLIDLHSKLLGIKENPVFTSYSNTSFDGNIPMQYAEFDSISGNIKNFVTIGWLVIRQWYKADKTIALNAINNGQRRPDSFYIIEEAHNFLKLPTFERIFDKMSREARKFGVHFIFLTQDAHDVNSTLANFFNTKIYIFTEKWREVAYEGVKYHNGNQDLKPELRFVFDKIRNVGNGNRMLFLLQDSGATGFYLPETTTEQSYFFIPKDFK